VSFDTIEEYKQLNILEVYEPYPWYISYISYDFSLWNEYKTNSFSKSRYKIEDSCIFIYIKIVLNSFVPYEALVYLINNPQCRKKWDKEVNDLEIVIGNPELDATVSISYENKSKKLYKRIIRKFEDVYIILYQSYDNSEKNNYILMYIYQSKKVKFFFKETHTETISIIEDKIEWASRFNSEVLAHKKSSCKFNN
jgi:hypothetical protein